MCQPQNLVFTGATNALKVEQEVSKTALPGGCPLWDPQRIKGIIGISGVYNCYGLADHLDRRGLYRSLFDRIMSIDGVPQLKLLSPIYCINVCPSTTESSARHQSSSRSLLGNIHYLQHAHNHASGALVISAGSML